MKTASIYAFVLMAIAMTATPVLAAEAVSPVAAVRTTAEQTQTENLTPNQQLPTPTPTLPASLSVRQRQPLTPTGSLTSTVGVTLTAAVEVTTTAALTDTTGALTEETALDDAALDEAYAAVLEGTIIANRADAPIRFFVEGRTYEVAPLRSIGLTLLRDTAVLNLFNCEATKDDSDAGCFWDPYLLLRDGFYEVVIGQQLGQDILLSLRTAGAPPSNQIWIQNRTGERETVIVNNELFEIAPAAVQEFAIDEDAPVIVQLRTCINAGERSICEWTPQGAEAGFYYGLVRTETPGPSNSQVTALALQAVIASSGETVKPPPQAFCRLRVPTLNVRSGPGLEFPIIAKIRGTDTEPGSVVVEAFDSTKTWMQVTERVARDGWVTANPEFILCDGALADLPVIGQPVVEATPEPTTAQTIAAPAETPVAAVAPTEAPTTAPTAVEAAPQPPAPAPAEAAPTEVETPAEQITPTPEVAEVPEGLARIVVNNGFDQTIRFTLDQRYRPERDNLSGEWDLEPGASVTILVYPGSIAFSASSAWRGLSGNAELVLNEKEDRALWITFVLDPIEKDRWNLIYY
ncbi:MAG: hypothetical protein BroJett021_20480 [Chloroflexota bacterium]|nr:hypothetical protein [Caldilinea sp.]GIK73060.1 MAG: hypothetical protein BroJett021_20480 [Chloroflexota bacterium]